MTTWTTCRCRRSHKSARGFLRCKLPALKWCTGAGDWALIAWCGNPTITLWPTHTEAADMGNLLHAIRCGRSCRGAHEIVHIQLTRERASA